MNTEIQKVYNHLKKIFKNADKVKMEINDDLLRNVAFMTVTLYKLQEEINDKGVVEKFEQGKQRFLRENPALKSYNTTLKNYASAIKQLNDMLPSDEPKTAGEDLMSFIAGNKK